jgi:hypothetical protein
MQNRTVKSTFWVAQSLSRKTVGVELYLGYPPNVFLDAVVSSFPALSLSFSFVTILASHKKKRELTS